MRYRPRFIEEAHWWWWQDMVIILQWITMENSIVCEWYQLLMTMVEDPKPIYNGVMLYKMCVTKVNITAFKVFETVYSVKVNG